MIEHFILWVVWFLVNHLEMRPNQENHAPPTAGTSSFSRRVFMIVCAIIGLIIARNFFTRDYTRETKSFLTSIGRADAIENVVPKTITDMQLERKKQLNVFDQLVANMTVVMEEYKGLRADINRLQAATGVKPANATESLWQYVETIVAEKAIIRLGIWEHSISSISGYWGNKMAGYLSAIDLISISE